MLEGGREEESIVAFINTGKQAKFFSLLVGGFVCTKPANQKG